jgi:site-specific DNA-methyltransferase (adenine-specific)
MNNCPGYNTTKDYEIAMICRKPGATLAKKWNTSFQDASNVEATKSTGHPFAKPFELTRAFVEMATLENQLILEPFAGGGSVVIEMLRSKRKVIGIEKETHHYNQMLENVKQFYLKQNPKYVFK